MVSSELKKRVKFTLDLQLSQKYGFQPPTLKPDNIGPPTLEKVHFRTLAGFPSGFAWHCSSADVSDPF